MVLFSRVSDGANALVEPAIAVLTGTMTALLVLSVFTRFVVHISIVETVEIIRISFVWAVFLAASAVAKRRQHVRVTFLADALPAAGRLAVHRGVDIIILGFGVAMVWFGAQMTLRMTATYLPTLQISQAWLYGALPVSGALIALHALADLLRPADPAGAAGVSLP